MKKYTKIGIDVANHFYEKESDSSEESSSEESNSEMEEESSDEMPLPTFLLNKHSMDFNPNEIEDTMSEKQIQKEEHKTRKSITIILLSHSLCKNKRKRNHPRLPVFDEQ